MTSPIYDFVCRNINDEPVNLSDYRGKVMLIVNTASYCGFTPQYKGLESLYREFKDRGFVILGFPSNQFAEEPFDNERINNFCLMNYSISFPLFSKTKVNGKDAEPLFSYLQQVRPGMMGIRRVPWNFTKFLVDREGHVIGRYPPLVFPSRLRQKINEVL